MDWVLLLVVLALVAVGLTMIYSATRAEMGTRKLVLQAIWVLVGLALMFLFACVDYSRWQSLAVPLLGATVLLLIVVLGLGHLVKGAARWIPLGPLNIQPSELLKIALILALSGFLASREEEVEDFGLVIKSLAYMGVPALLVLAQPDLGTPVLLFLVWLTMAVVAGCRLPQLGGITLAFLMLFVAAWGLNIIRPHQKERLAAFLETDTDPRGANWQQKQSLIAIGSGHFLGKGLFRGTQSRLRFVPDQETDFIFTVIGEEGGFVGSALVLGLFGLLLYRALAIAASAKDTSGRVMASGIAGMLLVHVVVNIGMATALGPVKGMPLPFVSYGGSNMLTMMVAAGLLQSIHIHRQKITF
jgi:rod shape determining protein RodA